MKNLKDAKDLIDLIHNISNDQAEFGVYQFEKYKIHLRSTIPMSNAERQEAWRNLHRQEVNEERRKVYKERKRIELCVKCYGSVKATHGRLCNFHYKKFHKGMPLKYKKIYKK